MINRWWIFALNLSNTKPIISIAREKSLLDKMHFCHLAQYCRSNTAVHIARMYKVSTSPAGIKYKFGILFPKGIKNSNELDKKNENHLWEGSIKIELEQLTEYQRFIVLDSGEDIPTDHQKILYRTIFGINYDPRP
jgi:hypothetical protein